MAVVGVYTNNDFYKANCLIYSNSAWQWAVPYVYTSSGWQKIGGINDLLIPLYDKNNQQVYDKNNQPIFVRRQFNDVT